MPNPNDLQAPDSPAPVEITDAAARVETIKKHAADIKAAIVQLNLAITVAAHDLGAELPKLGGDVLAFAHEELLNVEREVGAHANVLELLNYHKVAVDVLNRITEEEHKILGWFKRSKPACDCDPAAKSGTEAGQPAGTEAGQPEAGQPAPVIPAPPA